MTTYDQDRIEGQRRAQWLHDHNAPHDWLILTSGEIAVLKAAIPLWHAIDTAPHDGCPILAYGPSLTWHGETRTDVVLWEPYRGSSGGRWIRPLMAQLSFTPTHWMPLPTPPAAP